MGTTGDVMGIWDIRGPWDISIRKAFRSDPQAPLQPNECLNTIYDKLAHLPYEIVANHAHVLYTKRLTCTSIWKEGQDCLTHDKLATSSLWDKL